MFGSIEHFDVFTELAIKTRFGFLAQRAFGDQRLHHRRHFVVRMPRIVRQAIFHGVDDMGQGVQAHHIGGAEGGTLGTPEERACQGIHLVEAQSMRFSMMHGSKNGKYANAIGDEVRRIFRAHHAFAERGHEEIFQLIEDHRIGRSLGNQFDQCHIARRIEKMNAAKTLAQRFGKYPRERGDRQARRVAGEDRMLGDVRRDFFV